ncbi:MAG: inorganic phosphate transporter [Elusimicrobiota bacterium]|nr:inorganic phosphate transporter [Elusimicrobiota bacterium]
MGWGVGANDTANIFGPAVGTNAIKYKTAMILGAVFVLLGALIEGPGLMGNVGDLAGDLPTQKAAAVNLAFVASLAAAITITILTYMSVPSSTSQAAVGSIMGIGIALSGLAGAEWGGFIKMAIVWVVNPVLTAIVAFLMFKILAKPVNYFIKSDIWYNRVFSTLLVLSGSYGAYTLGASHAAVTTAPFLKAGLFDNINIFGLNPSFIAAAIGGFGMSLGVVTYSKKVIETVGKKITVLDPFSAFISVMSAALTVHICKSIGVPVSSSQAIVGSIAGVGFVHGAQTINFNSLKLIFLGWVMTPFAGAIFSYGLIKVFL